MEAPPFPWVIVCPTAIRIRREPTTAAPTVRVVPPREPLRVTGLDVGSAAEQGGTRVWLIVAGGYVWGGLPMTIQGTI